MKYLVTGGAGFIGRHIVDHLLENSHSVDIIDNFHNKNEKNHDKNENNLELFQVDIRNKSELSKIIEDYDGIFHQAALTSVNESFEKTEEYQSVNVEGSKNIFEIANEKNIRVVFASSSSIYGNTTLVPIKEELDRNPISPYGKTKSDVELLAEKFSNQGLDVIGLRYFNVYGKGQTNSYAGVISKFLENIRFKRTFTIFGDGCQSRDFIHVKDIANANLSIMKSKIKSGFFNIGTGIPTTINELAELMIDISGHTEGIQHIEPLEGDIKDSFADMSKTQKNFQWNHTINLSEGLQKFIENYL